MQQKAFGGRERLALSSLDVSILLLIGLAYQVMVKAFTLGSLVPFGGNTMFRRILGALIVFTALTATSINLATAGTDNGKGNGGSNNGNQNGKNGAPELDPSYLGSGVLLLAGGVLLLSEHRRRD